MGDLIPAVIETSPSQACRADGWQGPYYGLFPARSVVPPSMPTDEFRRSIIERKQELKRELLSLDALLNTSVPINKLPIELLAEIIAFAQVDPENAKTLHWLTFLQVCRHWFVVASTTPSLWRHLRASTSLNYLSTCLARSKSVLVDVEIWSSEVIPQALDLLAPHRHRLRHVNLFTVSHADIPHLSEFLQSPMHALEVLHADLRDAAFSPCQVVKEFPPEFFPRLQGISLGSISMPSSPILRKLRLLHLSGWHNVDPNSGVDLLINIFRCLECIEMLYVDNVLPRDHPHPPDEKHVVRTTLPKLRSLSLDMHANATKHILSALSIPPSAKVSIRRRVDTMPWDPTSLETGLRAAMPTDRAGLPILAQMTQAHVKILFREHSIQGTAPSTPDGQAGGELMLSLQIPGDYVGLASLLHHDFRDICGSAPLEVLRIDARASRVQRIDWRATLADFPRLREFTLSGEDDDEVGVDQVHHVFAGLNPENAPDGVADAERVVCPRLQKVRIEIFSARHNTLLPVITRCLASRRSALGQPKALEELAFKLAFHGTRAYFEGRKSRFVERLRQYVDRVSYEWDGL